MSAVDLGQWVSIAGIAVFAIGLFTYLDRKFDRVESKLDATRTELKTDIDAVRTELKTDIDAVRTEFRSDITRLDERVFALAAGLKPRIAPAEHP